MTLPRSVTRRILSLEAVRRYACDGQAGRQGQRGFRAIVVRSMLAGGPGLYQGFTMIELLVVMAIIAVLAAMAVPAIGVVRNVARTTEATLRVGQLAMALDRYGTEDGKHRLPNTELDRGISRRAGGILDALEDCGLTHAGADLNADQVLVDPWRQPWRYVGSASGAVAGNMAKDLYELGRPEALRAWDAANWRAAPVPAARQGRCWNWDPDATQAGVTMPTVWRRTADVLNATGNAVATQGRPLAYAYVWSLGKSANEAAPDDWIFPVDGRP